MTDRLQALRDAQRAHGKYVSGLFEKHGGNRIRVDADEWDGMTSAGDSEKSARAALIPTEQDAIDLMHDCYIRLKELGWNDPQYCPKDGSEFDVIEIGSTGIFKCRYQGEWPKGTYWLFDGEDSYSSRPAMYRKTEAEIARWAELSKRFRDATPPSTPETSA